MTAAVLALLLAATPARYGGELRVLVPPSALEPERMDPQLARSPLELELARTVCEPLDRLDGSAALQPGAAELPEVDARLSSLTLRLRPGATPPREVTALLGALASPGNPYRALTLPLLGPGALRADGAVVLSLRFPYPDWPRALSHVGACPLAAGHRGSATGPFIPSPRLAAPAARLVANADDPAGRPYADALGLRTAGAKGAARSLAAGEAELSLVSPGEGRVDGPLSVATYLVVNPARPRLSGLAALVDQAIDRGELVRTFVHGPAAPLNGLLAPSNDPQPAPPTPPGAPAPLAPISAELLVDASGEGRAVADRLQVKLHDRGASLRVLALPRRELEQRVGNGQYDLALVAVPALPDPGLNLAQVLLLVLPPEQVQKELAALGALPDAAARSERAQRRARALAPTLPVVPLYAQGLSVAVRGGVRGLRFEATGTLDLGGLWLESSGPPHLPGTR